MIEPALDLLVGEPGEAGPQLEHDPGHDHVLELAHLPAILDSVPSLALEPEFLVLGLVLQSAICWICH